LATGLATVDGSVVSITSLLETGVSDMDVGSVVTVRGTLSQSDQAIDASVLVIHGR
jgi:primosomal replication protein N